MTADARRLEPDLRLTVPPAIAGGTQKAAVKTAGVFARLGRSTARSF
jgi:hypothetical protein